MICPGMQDAEIIIMVLISLAAGAMICAIFLGLRK
jgi:hypothetical protein